MVLVRGCRALLYARDHLLVCRRNDSVVSARGQARAFVFVLLAIFILLPFFAVAVNRTYGMEGGASPEPTPEPTIIATADPTTDPMPSPTATPEITPDPTPAPTLTPDEILQDTWFARRTVEELQEWAATQEAQDRDWLASEISSRGTEPFIKTLVCASRPIYYDEDGTLVGYVESCVEHDSWTWSPCWPPEAMPWYPSDFPPPAIWDGIRSGCR